MYDVTWEENDDGDEWANIRDADGEEFAVVMCRKIAQSWPNYEEVVTEKCNRANHIADALNAYKPYKRN